MRRKVIQIANSTQLISLPRKWALSYNIKKGDELEIEESGKNLIISIDKEFHIEKAEVNYTTFEKFITRPIRVLYKLGYDEIDVNFEDPSVFEAIQLEMQNLLGFEIVNQGRKRCTIKSVATATYSEFDPILRRIFLMLITMAKDSYSLIAEKNFERLKDITLLEKTNNKLILFCLRLLGKSGYKEYKRTSLIYITVSLLEHIADDFRDACVYLMETKPKLGKKTMDCYKLLGDQVELFYKLFYKQGLDVKDLFEFRQKSQAINVQAKALLGSGLKQEIMVAHYILKINSTLYHALESLH
jgi:phosphate uptake regulator